MAKSLNETERAYHAHITERLVRLRTKLEAMEDDDNTHRETRARIHELKQLQTYIEADPQ